MEKYINIVKHYEHCFQKYGDTHQGVDWPNMADLHKRYEVMLQIMGEPQINTSILDFGCGNAMLYEYSQNHPAYRSVNYSGLDIGANFIQHCREKYPNLSFYENDILNSSEAIPNFDFVIMNGVLTEKLDLTFDEMWDYAQKLLLAVFERANVGIAFNVMSKAVDWERNDLFHMPTDTLINFITKSLNRKFVIRNDYGLYEYTTYVYK